MMEMALKKMNLCLCLMAIGVSMALMVNADDYIKATCEMDSLNETNRTVSGQIILWQSVTGGNTSIVGNLTGFTWDGLHGFHVHEFGNLSNSCEAAGLHYNPYNKTHGGPNDTDRHVGDLGNIRVDFNNSSVFHIVDSMIQLQGNDSVINRTLVVHSGEDDLGRGNEFDSNTTGHSGYRIGCCIIQLNPNAMIPTIPSTTPTVHPTSPTTKKPTGSAFSIRPIMTVSVLGFVAAQLIQKFL